MNQLPKTKVFYVHEGRLLHDGHVIGKSEYEPGFEWLEFDDSSFLGGGANGAAFRGRHKILGVDHVIKIYFPDEDFDNVAPYLTSKASLEAKKNALPELSQAIATVFHAGRYSYPIDLEYSIMDSISNPVTLREWQVNSEDFRKFIDIERSDESAKVRAARRAERERSIKYLKQIGILKSVSLNTAAGFLGAAISLFSTGISHGDLNAGNILFKDKPRRPDFYEEFYRSLAQREILGSLNPHDTRLIDLGSSDVPGTTKSYGAYRDCFFLVDNIRKLLRFDFPDFDINFITSDMFKSRGAPENCETHTDAPLVLATELLRLVSAMSIIEGLRNRASNDNDPHFLDSDDFVILNPLIVPVFEFNNVAMFEPSANLLLKNCEIENRKKLRFVDWNRFWDGWASKIENFGKYRLGDSWGGIRKK